MNATVDEMKLLLRSRYGGILLETEDPDRALQSAKRLSGLLSIPLFVWSSTSGLKREDEAGPIFGTQGLKGALNHIRASRFPSIYYLRASDDDMENSHLVDTLEEACRAMEEIAGGILLGGLNVSIPAQLKGHVTKVALPSPSPDEYKAMLVGLVRDLSKKRKVKVKLTQEQANRLIQNLRGFTLLEAEKVLTKAIIVDDALTEKDIQGVIQAKTEIVQRDGLLEYYPADSQMTDIAGLRGLKHWLRKRKSLLNDPKKAEAFGLQFPKGILLLGIPGTGKSLCAKAVGMEWSLPLLKMDPGALYNRYVGQTEENFRRAMDIAEKMSPVVLWIDEIEKAFQSSGSDSNDGGLSGRVLGTFLNWMQERAGEVFVVATANDVSRLPPELLRKGRLDEIFFLDLPDSKAREELFSIHLKKKNLQPAEFDLEMLANEAEGFTGADIEQAVISSIFTAFERGGQVELKDVLQEVKATKCLAEVMPEKIQALRDWANGRTVSAD